MTETDGRHLLDEINTCICIQEHVVFFPDDEVKITLNSQVYLSVLSAFTLL